MNKLKKAFAKKDFIQIEVFFLLHIFTFTSFQVIQNFPFKVSGVMVCTIQIDHAIYLKDAFACVSQVGLPEWMHSRIGCICLTFPHCVFSYVCSNRLHMRMHNHIGCICLACHLSVEFQDYDPSLLRKERGIEMGDQPKQY